MNNFGQDLVVTVDKRRRRFSIQISYVIEFLISFAQCKWLEIIKRNYIY
jgi:hypothetical protein